MVDIDSMLNKHYKVIEDCLNNSSDIIRIMDLIVKEINELEEEVKNLVQSIPDKVFVAFQVTGAVSAIKAIQELYLEEVKERLENLNKDFSVYLDSLGKKRIINNLDKVLLLNLSKLLLDVTYGNTYSVNMLDRIENNEKRYYK